MMHGCFLAVCGRFPMVLATARSVKLVTQFDRTTLLQGLEMAEKPSLAELGLDDGDGPKVKVKRCPMCDATDIPVTQRECGACSAIRLSSSAATTSGSTMRRFSAPTGTNRTAALLSFLIPGAGQIYKGQTVNGFVWLLCVAVGYVCFVIPGLVLHVCCMIGAAKE